MLKNVSALTCSILIILSGCITYLSFPKKNEEKIEPNAVYTPRQNPPQNISEWKPNNLKIEELPMSRTEYIASSGTVQLESSGRFTDLWSNGNITRVEKNGFLNKRGILIPFPPDRFDPHNEVEYIPQRGEYHFEFRKPESQIYGWSNTPKEQPVKKKIADIDLRNKFFYRFDEYCVNEHDEVIYATLEDRIYKVFRSKKLAEPELMLEGKSDKGIWLLDCLPAELKPGNHLIISDGESWKVYSNGIQWNLQSYSGYKAIPSVFITPDIVAGRLMKVSKDNLLVSGTIAFWNRKGQICTIEDALPSLKHTFKTLLSTQNGFTLKSWLITNHKGLAAINLDNRHNDFNESPSQNRKSTIIFSITP